MTQSYVRCLHHLGILAWLNEEVFRPSKVKSQASDNTEVNSFIYSIYIDRIPAEIHVISLETRRASQLR